ncbi:hypothetical protein [Aureivirga sp. CE67]|uniref:hypothetical protein n=1 Tax=Aureivirga sp. CE67 TaxID=1788983 RepID=UPI0018C949B5|nr:hypothetical protein [Aureivirga sp. CE67]
MNNKNSAQSKIFIFLGIIFSIIALILANKEGKIEEYQMVDYLAIESKKNIIISQSLDMGTIGFALISASCFICSAIVFNKE